MTLSFKLCVVLVVFGVIHSSQGQYWKNEKRDKHSSVGDGKSSSSVSGSSSVVQEQQAAAKSGPYEYGRAPEYKDDYAHVPAYEHVPASVYEHHPASYAHEYKPPSYHAPAYQAPAYHAPSYSAPVYSVHEYKAPSYETHESHEHVAAHGQGYHHSSSSYESSHEYPAPAPAYPSSHESYPAPSYQPSYSQASNPLPSVLPYGAYPIQQPTITNTGETIIENLVGGIPFDCHGKPTGHYRDYKYCDIFHACVFGVQRKTYACPYVGERTFFDEVTKRCEFVYKNPSGCGLNAYYH